MDSASDPLSERRGWTARIEPKQLVLLDVGYVVDNVLPPFQGEKRVVFLAILAVARMVIWTTGNKGLYDDANFSHRDLHFVDGGMGGQPNGEFFLRFSGFFSHSHHTVVVNKS